MGMYSSWTINFKRLDGECIDEIMDQVNSYLCEHRLGFAIPHEFEIAYNSDNKEAEVSWESTSYSEQDYIEKDLREISAAFPDLIFHCCGFWDNDEPVFYINAQGGELEHDYPEIVYHGFNKIIYEETEKQNEKLPPRYAEDEIQLAIEDMNRLTSMLQKSIPAGCTPSTEVAAWALREILNIHYSKE